MAKHTILGGKVHVYRRENSRFWQCSTFMQGKNHRTSTKCESLGEAKDFAEDWYLTLRGKNSRGELVTERTFKHAAAVFEREYEVITEGERSPKWVEGHKARIRLHLMPYFGKLGLSQITAGKVQDYRVERMTNPWNSKVPSQSTLHDEIVTLRLVLKAAIRHDLIDHLPDFSAPYKASRKVSHRAWFSPEEYKSLYTATRENARNAKGARNTAAASHLHDKILFLANTGLRPDEAKQLQFRDVEIVEDRSTEETILEISVRGKRGVGYCKSMPGAVMPFKRMLERSNPEPSDNVFPTDHKKQFNRILEELDLKFDRDGNRRTLYSLRHSYISFRLLEGADIYQIAKNCRTSVEMIERHYASHIKNRIDARAINVRRDTQ